MGGLAIAAYLLDTHVFLWAMLTPEKLSPSTSELLGNGHGIELALSVISLWETVHLARKGKVDLHPNAFGWLAHSLSTTSILSIPITAEIALESHRITLPHQDPADRFIAATAKIMELTLITADEKLLACQDISVLSAR